MAYPVNITYQSKGNFEKVVALTFPESKSGSVENLPQDKTIFSRSPFVEGGWGWRGPVLNLATVGQGMDKGRVGTQGGEGTSAPLKISNTFPKFGQSCFAHRDDSFDNRNA